MSIVSICMHALMCPPKQLRTVFVFGPCPSTNFSGSHVAGPRHESHPRLATALNKQFGTRPNGGPIDKCTRLEG